MNNLSLLITSYFRFYRRKTSLKLLKETGAVLNDSYTRKSNVKKTTDTATTELNKKDLTDANFYTIIDVRKVFAAKSHAGFTDQANALITKYGAE